MENCFVFKFNSEVNNSSLPILGTSLGYIRKPASDTWGSLTITSGKKVTITIQSDVDLWWNSSKTKKSREFTGTGSSQYFTFYGDYEGVATCVIENYWNINFFNPSYLGMNIAAFTPVSNAITIVPTGPSGLIFGDIADFGNVNATSLNINNNPNLGGSINELADKMFTAGRTSGSFAVYATGTGIKKNGVSLAATTINFTSEGWTFA